MCWVLHVLHSSCYSAARQSVSRTSFRLKRLKILLMSSFCRCVTWIRHISLNSKWVVLWFFLFFQSSAVSSWYLPLITWVSVLYLFHVWHITDVCHHYQGEKQQIWVENGHVLLSHTSCVTVVGITIGSAAFGLIMRELSRAIHILWLLPHCPLSLFLSITGNSQSELWEHHFSFVYFHVFIILCI